MVAASKLVPDDVVQLITASGTPDECRAKVAEYVAAGCTCPVLYPLGADVGAMIDAFAELDALRRDVEYAEYLRRLPKVELHCHVEGTLRPQTVVDLAAQARHRAADRPTSTASTTTTRSTSSSRSSGS